MNLNIDAFEDKNPIYCAMDDSPVLNITGEGGSGKTTYSQQYKDNPEYIVVDYDVVLLGTGSKTDIKFYLRKKLKINMENQFLNLKELMKQEKNLQLFMKR